MGTQHYILRTLPRVTCTPVLTRIPVSRYGVIGELTPLDERYEQLRDSLLSLCAFLPQCVSASPPSSLKPVDTSDRRGGSHTVTQ
jgi:hypothetical protein